MNEPSDTTVSAAVLRALSCRAAYHRQLLPTDDGGTLALDWFLKPGTVQLPAETPVVLVLHGLTGRLQQPVVSRKLSTSGKAAKRFTRSAEVHKIEHTHQKRINDEADCELMPNLLPNLFSFIPLMMNPYWLVQSASAQQGCHKLLTCNLKSSLCIVLAGMTLKLLMQAAAVKGIANGCVQQ